ncbi:GGDEF domain-containing phosphodiesterase [uncultured Roseobacter sp.]|uniref:putative bifunctional diguanylate cyclase/phosphodiesterase n=1 Tax=uncultured Roseobacter sp. TaxID=114847 RepID=UPI002636448F|nr:GGDEF domain-containing phosphodiesterase [uncultured Roseobacter sp.]
MAKAARAQKKIKAQKRRVDAGAAQSGVEQHFESATGRVGMGSLRISDMIKPQNPTDTLVESIADQLCTIVEDNYDIQIQVDGEGVTESLQVQKLTVLINSLLENVRRNIGSLSKLAQDLETKVRERTLKLDLIVQSSNDGVWLWDLPNDCVEYSPRWRQLMGLDNERLNKIDDWLLKVHPDDQERLRSAIRAHLQGTTHFLTEDYRILHADGTYRWVWCRGRCHRDQNGRPILMAGTQTDVHQLRSIDASTGLPNEDSLQSTLEDIINRKIPFRAMVIGVPRVISMKEELGSDELSALRKAIAYRLSSSLPFVSDLAHLSGEYYAAILTQDIGAEDLHAKVLESVLDAFTRPFSTGLRNIQLDVAIGVTQPVHEFDCSPSDVMRDAWASYRCARNSGHRSNILNEEQIEAARDRAYMQEQVRRGLERGWFVPYFQPIVDMKSERTLGFETLCRMSHPDLGILPPARFIPIAEELGVMDAIGERMLTRALDQLATWANMGAPFGELFLTVNLEAQQMMQQDFPQKLGEGLRARHIPAQNLKLEIVESSMVGNFASASRQIGLLRELGVKIALDDFGTGYSSLEYLNELTFDLIKIDKAFVDDVENDPRKKSMVKMICVLAETLGAQICVEGIENDSQAAIMVDLNVTFGQGYMFSKPLPADTLHTALQAI